MDEQLLIDGCMRGESWARKELYEQYAPAMMSVCMRYVGDRETARDLLQDGLDGYDDSLEDINYSVLDRLSADDLLACVAQLPPGYRTVFNLYAIEGYTHSEIAEMLHVQEATSRSQFIRARNALQKSVQSLIRHENAGR